MDSPAEIKFYTHPGSAWSARVQIALRALDLKYEEVIIDLDKPRPDWYLKDINPRGLVPALHYKNNDIDEVLTESSVIVRFLTDAYPGKLVPVGDSPKNALRRAHVDFFADTFLTKVLPHLMGVIRVEDEAERQSKAKDAVAVLDQHMTPLLQDAAPFFGGSKDITLAEILIAPFILRLYDFIDDIIFPKVMLEDLRKLSTFDAWAQACLKHDCVKYGWDKEVRAQRTRDALWKQRPGLKAPEQK